MSKVATDWAESLPTLPSGVKPLLVHLARFARKDDHTCFRPQEVIAEAIDQSIRTVERNIAWLKENGLISSKRHYKNGVRVADEITLNVGVTLPVNLSGSRPSKCRVSKQPLPVNHDDLTRQLEGAYPSTTTNPSLSKLTNKQNKHCDVVAADEALQEKNNFLMSENEALKAEIEALKKQLADAQTAPQENPVAVHKTAPRAKANKSEQQQANADTWQAYANAYFNRYGIEPLRNAKTNSQIASFVTAVGTDLAPVLARYYVNLNNPFYLQKTHAVGLLLSDAEPIRTQYLTGRQITRKDIQRVEAAQVAQNLMQDVTAQGEPW